MKTFLLNKKILQSMEFAEVLKRYNSCGPKPAVPVAEAYKEAIPSTSLWQQGHETLKALHLSGAGAGSQFALHSVDPPPGLEDEIHLIPTHSPPVI